MEREYRGMQGKRSLNGGRCGGDRGSLPPPWMLTLGGGLLTTTPSGCMRLMSMSQGLHRGRHIAAGRVHNQVLRAGTDGMLAFTRADAKSGNGRVRVVIDYALPAKAYGGGFCSQLRLYHDWGCWAPTAVSAGVALRAGCRSRPRWSALIVGLSGWQTLRSQARLCPHGRSGPICTIAARLATTWPPHRTRQTRTDRQHGTKARSQPRKPKQPLAVSRDLRIAMRRPQVPD